MKTSNKERELLLRLIELTDREDGYYVVPGVSRESGNAGSVELVDEWELLFDDIVQLLVDEGELDE